MKSLIRDMLNAMLVGLILPGILLNYAEILLHKEETIISPVQESSAQDKTLKMRMRDEEGNVVLRDMDSYLVEVLLAEVPSSFEEEALKAQAVAARTYTRKAWETGGKHGDSSVCTQPGCCQAWISSDAYLAEGGSQEGIRKMEKAVFSTSGEVLCYQGELIEATYFSCSGGSTEEAIAVWGSNFPYLQAVSSPGEENAAHYTDTMILTEQQFRQCLDTELEGEPCTWFGSTTYTAGGGVDTMVIGGKTYSGTQLRSMLGLNSTAFEITADKNVTIKTHGYGHRVGMSQYGADAMAVAGSTYEEILAHYYRGAILTQLD